MSLRSAKESANLVSKKMLIGAFHRYQMKCKSVSKKSPRYTTWGINYSGFKIPEAKGEIVAGTEQPVFYWKDSPAVSGMAFYNSDKFPQWQQKLFIGALKDKDVIVMSVNGDKVTEDGRILTDRGQRIRDVRTGPDGYLYVLTDESSGELLKVSPRN